MNLAPTTPILAWHFVGPALRDGRSIPPDGEPLPHPPEDIVLCRSGLHASRKVLDALNYAPGGTVCRVRCAGRIIEGDDKLVCSERTILWRVNADGTLRHFARLCALDVVDMWDAPDVVRWYLKTGDPSLQAAAQDAARDAAAWDAARAAAQDAAWDAATWDAAWDAPGAARAAARAAAWAARAAAWAAAGAARAAARAAARDAQETRLVTMLEDAR